VRYQWIGIVLLAVFALSGQANTLQGGPNNRIVGGEPVEENALPWMAAIFESINGEFSQVCGGSLIASRWILSAAHCFVNPGTGDVAVPENLAVVLGFNDLDDPDLLFREIVDVQVHPDYDVPTSRNDIALLELSEDYAGTVISLPSRENTVPEAGEVASVAGWGVTAEGGFGSADLLQVDLSVVPHNECFPWYPGSLDPDLMVCARGSLEGGMDSCQGDSGGPLFVRRDGLNVQAGIVSFGFGCARPGVPGAYTRVSSLYDWITATADGASPYQGPSSAADPATTVSDLQTGVPVSGELLAGQTLSFVADVDALSFILTSDSGDSDLYVYGDTLFASDTLLCSSLNVASVDSCEIEPAADAVIVQVLAFEDTRFTLLASSDSVPVPESELLEIDVPFSGTVAASEVLLFTVAEGDLVTLTSFNGDADLYIVTDANSVDPLCSSLLVEPVDECPVDTSAGPLLAVVLGFSATDFSIVVTGSSEGPADSPPVSAGVPVCDSADSDSDGDGWGWENEMSCIVMADASEPPPSLPAGSSEFPFCLFGGESDSDGDGFGWENEATCIVADDAQQQPDNDGGSQLPACEFGELSDPDGDGWGWENGMSCVVQQGASGIDPDAIQFTSDGFPICVLGDLTDPDGDGWGYENGVGCVVQ